jgi:predicted Zn-dependent protease
MTTRSGLLVAIAGALVLGFAAFVILSTREKEPAPEPTGESELALEPVPLGKTVEQELPGYDGKPETWTLSKQEVEREKLPEMVLPQPQPRRAPPDDSARALEAQALETWKQGDLEGALAMFDAALEADPDDPQVLGRYGRLLALMTDYERAYPLLERAAQVKPEDPQVWLDLLSFYEKNVLLERAGYAREKAQALAGGVPITQDENGFYFLEGNRLFP